VNVAPIEKPRVNGEYRSNAEAVRCDLRGYGLLRYY
jgi:hypothetical protein